MVMFMHGHISEHRNYRGKFHIHHGAIPTISNASKNVHDLPALRRKGTDVIKAASNIIHELHALHVTIPT